MTQTLSLRPVCAPTEEIDVFFVLAIRALRAHYRAAGQHVIVAGDTAGRHVPPPPPFAMPFPLPAETAQPLSEKVPRADLRKATGDLLAEVRCIGKNTRDQAHAAVEQYEKDHDAVSFQARVEQLKRIVKDYVDKSIDRMFAAVERIGQQFPQVQPLVLDVATRVSNFLTGLVTTVANFFANLVENIVAWAKRAWGKVENFFENAADSADHFFGGVS